jgi:nucleoside-diphosphate-sugar epimerase
MRILVTGGAGHVGPAVVERLSRAGHEITVTGRRERADVKGARYAQCDTTDLAALLPLVRRAETVVHLAAMPSPGANAPEEIFRINACGAFNVFEAAARAGIRRVVCASSINALGFNWGCRPFPITRLPVDEETPGFTTDPYSFSKQVTEQVADYAWRRDGISGTCLRLTFVAPARMDDRAEVAAHVARCRASLDALMALSEAERMERVRSWIAHRDAYRAGRFVEKGRAGQPYQFPDPLEVWHTDFWTRIDERDAAQAVERSITADYEGSHPLFINDTHNITGVPSLALARLFFPEARLDEERLSATSSLVSIDAARKLIGFEPEHSVGRWF